MTRYAAVAAELTSIKAAMSVIRIRLPAFAAAEDAEILADAAATLRRLDKEVWKVADALDESLYGTPATR